MIVVTIIGILVSIALPAYQDYIIRTRVIEGVVLLTGAKTEVVTNGLTTKAELSATAITWNAQANGSGGISKYVSQIQINPDSGEIEIMFNSKNVGAIASSSTLVYIPYIQPGGTPVQLADAFNSAITGPIDWGCASSTNTLAINRNFPAIKMGTLEPKYAPSECR